MFFEETSFRVLPKDEWTTFRNCISDNFLWNSRHKKQVQITHSKSYTLSKILKEILLKSYFTCTIPAYVFIKTERPLKALSQVTIATFSLIDIENILLSCICWESGQSRSWRSQLGFFVKKDAKGSSRSQQYKYL